MPDEKPPMRISQLADQCVQCGMCLPVCPTYALDGNEAESPRGRIALAAALARGQVTSTPALREHLDHCLGCMNCEKVCPANVEYGELLVQTRALLGPPPERPAQLLTLIQQPKAWARLRRVARWTGFGHWKAWATPLLGRSKARRAALALWPRWSDRPEAVPTVHAPANSTETFALFPGCVASVEDQAAQEAAVTLLQAAGYRVVTLPAFCCGAMDRHDGVSAGADAAAERVRQAWNEAGASALLSVTPGCIGTLRHALPNVRVADPVSLLAERAGTLQFRALHARVALHVPCTQYNVARSDQALISLLRLVPGLDLQPLPRPPFCCGAAGSHMLTFPDRANLLRDKTLRQVATLAPQRLLSSNIGCRMHLAAGMDGDAVPTQHPLVLLAQQLDLSR